MELKFIVTIQRPMQFVVFEQSIPAILSHRSRRIFRIFFQRDKAESIIISHQCQICQLIYRSRIDNTPNTFQLFFVECYYNTRSNHLHSVNCSYLIRFIYFCTFYFINKCIVGGCKVNRITIITDHRILFIQLCLCCNQINNQCIIALNLATV